jgi:hypothetical protein
VYSAIVQHTRWKLALKNTIETGTIWEGYEPNPEQCEFGRWMQENKLELQGLTRQQHFDKVDHLHREFHFSAERIVEAAIRGEKNKAQAELDYGSKFDHTSQDLVKAIIAWHDELTAK